MLKGEDLAPELEEFSGFDVASTRHSPAPVEYNPDVPIETFDVIITDECHRSIYNLLEAGAGGFRRLPDWTDRNPRIVVTVDMKATGTDIKPVEVVFFMHNVRSRSFFEQIKGRGVRTISPTDFNAVTPDARNNDRFLIVDAVGVTETELSDSYTLERQPTVPFDMLLDLVSMGDRDPEILSSLASRLARLDRHLTP